MHRKGSGTKSYNLFLECPPCLVLSKMADKISMSQRVTSQRYIPNNVTLKKRTICILRPVPAFGEGEGVISGTIYNMMALQCSPKKVESA